jgi:hypothetical protein
MPESPDEAEMLRQRYAEERSARMKLRAQAMLEDIPNASAPGASVSERYKTPPRAVTAAKIASHPNEP